MDVISNILVVATDEEKIEILHHPVTGTRK